MKDMDERRAEMVERWISGRGVRDPRLLAAMRDVPREAFLPEHLHAMAHEDHPLPVAVGEVALQPYVVAYMIEALDLKGGAKVLEIGAGTGYAAAILSLMAGEVFAIERNGALAAKAAAALQDTGCANVRMLHDAGTRGWSDEGPFDAILVSAAVPHVPETLKNQLAPGGRMMVPVGTDPRAQELVRVTRRAHGRFDHEDLADLRFVPDLGDQGIRGSRASPQCRNRPSRA